MGKENLQMEEILQYSKWKYCCDKFYVSLTLTNLTILYQMWRRVILGSSHKLRICKNSESGRSGLQLFGVLFWNSTEQAEESREREVIYV